MGFAVGECRFGVGKRIGASQFGDAIGGGSSGGGNAAVEKDGDLGVGQTRQVVVGHGLALFGWQCSQGRVQVEIMCVGSLVGGGVGRVGNREGSP
jgi:hypothetical protein